MLASDEGSATLYDHDQSLTSQLLKCATDRESAELVFLGETQLGRNSLTRGKLA